MCSGKVFQLDIHRFAEGSLRIVKCFLTFFSFMFIFDSSHSLSLSFSLFDL